MNKALATLSVGMLLAGGAGTARALGQDAAHRAPCPEEDAMRATTAAEAAQAAARADEERVTAWLVERILALDACADPVIDFSAADIARGTGVDAAKLDLDRVSRQVRSRLVALSRWGDLELRPPARPTEKSRAPVATPKNSGEGTSRARATSPAPGAARGFSR